MLADGGQTTGRPAIGTGRLAVGNATGRGSSGAGSGGIGRAGQSGMAIGLST